MCEKIKIALTRELHRVPSHPCHALLLPPAHLARLPRGAHHRQDGTFLQVGPWFFKTRFDCQHSSSFSSGVSPTSVDTMCRSLGHKRGFKLPPSLLGHPDNLPPHFVLQVTEQYIGSAQSFVDSLLSARAMRRTSLTAGSPPGTVGAAKTTTSSPSSAPTSLCQSQA